MTALTHEHLLSILDYCQETGIFTWKVNHRWMAKSGDIAGHKRSNGYIAIKINRKYYEAQRLAWMYVYGEFPIAHIDHINGIRDDNRIVNLRTCTKSQNGMNRKIHSNNTSGYRGVVQRKGSNKWVAVACKKYIGTFDTKEEASAAYEKVTKEKYGDFYREVLK